MGCCPNTGHEDPEGIVLYKRMDEICIVPRGPREGLCPKTAASRIRRVYTA